MMKDSLDLEAIEARANAATEGPWVWEPPSGDAWPNADESLVTESGESVLMGWGYDACGINGETADREFIAHAREDIPALIAEVRRLREAADDIRTEALADYEREMFILPGRTWVNVQWKGVDLCADIECECGASSHIDSDRTYGRWTCHQCGKTFQLAWTQTAYEVEPYGSEVVTEADPA